MTAPRLARPANPGEPGYADGGRVYEHPKTKMVVPSITATKGMLAKDKLKYYTASQAANYADENWEELSKLESGERRKLIREAHETTTRNAGNVGDLVHNAIDHHIKTSEQPSQGLWDSWPITAKNMWRQFSNFLSEYKPQWIDAEFTVWSNTWGYAGTMDWAANIRGWLVLGDTKTGKSTYPDMGLQLAAGMFADFILRDDGTEVPIPEFDRCAVLHVRPRSATLVPMERIPECWEAFKATRVLKHWHDYVSPEVIKQAPKLTKEAG